MVRHHIAQRPRRIVEAAAMSDAEFLKHADLHVVDMIAIPDRLEHSVCEPQHQDVLYRLFPEIVIDPVDLMLVDNVEELLVQDLRGTEVAAERLLDDQPPPGV